MNLPQTQNISKDFITSEFIKCRLDPNYFINTYLIISHPKKGKIPFTTFDYQTKLIQDFVEHQYNIINKARQLGVSTVVIGYIVWMMTFFQEKEIVLLSIKSDYSKRLIAKAKLAIDSLPKWLKVPRITNNKMSIELVNGSKVTALSTTEDAGRSIAASLVVLDECAFIANIAEIWKAMWPTLSTGGDCIILSSPNGAANWFCEMYMKAEMKANTFHPTTLTWRVHPDFTEEWAKKEKQNTTRRLWNQEREAKFLGSGNNIIDIDLLEKIHKPRIKQPIEKKWNGQLHIFEQPIPGESYIIGSDTARGDGSDNSTFIVTRVEKITNRKICVASYKKEVSTDIMASYSNELGKEYNNALLCIENNNTGLAVLMMLKDLGYTNIYYTLKGREFNTYINPDNRNYQKALNNKEDEMVIGFSTTSKTRPIVLDKFALAVEKDTFEFYDQRLYDEILSWIWKDGRYDHESGKHDDLILGASINNFVWEHLMKLEKDAKKIDEINKIALKINADIVQEKQKSKNNILESYKKLDNKRRFQKINSHTTIDLNDLYDKN